MIHIYHSDAEPELLAALRFYRNIDRGPGADLKERINRIISDIKTHPQLFRLRVGKFRRANLERLPFYLPYIIRGE